MKRGINEEGNKWRRGEKLVEGKKRKEDKKELLELRNKEELISNRDCWKQKEKVNEFYQKTSRKLQECQNINGGIQNQSLSHTRRQKRRRQKIEMKSQKTSKIISK